MRDSASVGSLSGLYLRSLALSAGEPGTLNAFLQSQGGDHVAKALLDDLRTKADAPALSTGDFSISAVARDFVAAVQPFSAIAQLPLRVTPYRVRSLTPASLTGGIVDETHPIPLTLGSLDEFQLAESVEAASIIALTKQQLAAMTPAGEQQLASDLASAVAVAQDRQFLIDIAVGQHDFTSAGTSLANTDADLKRALNDFDGDLRRAYWVTAPRTAAGLALLRGSGGAAAFPNVTARGGELLGLPLIVSDAAYDVENSPADSNVYLVDPSRICYADLGAKIDRATSASLQMKTNPSDGATNAVSLFQTNAVAVRAVLSGAWHALTGAVVRINSVDL